MQIALSRTLSFPRKFAGAAPERINLMFRYVPSNAQLLRGLALIKD